MDKVSIASGVQSSSGAYFPETKSSDRARRIPSLVSATTLIYVTYVLINAGLLFKAQGLRSLGYLVYAPILLGFIFLAYKGIKDRRLSLNLPVEAKAFLLIFLNGLVHIAVIPVSGVFQLFFLLAALLPLLTIRRADIDMRVIATFFVISFVFIALGRNFELDLSLDSLVRSNTSSLETNQHPFVFGLLALYFAHTRQKLWFFILLAFCLLSFKRIVVLGVLVCLPFALYESKRVFGALPRAAVFVGVCAGCYLLYLLSLGELDNLIIQWFDISTGWFTQGRDSLLRGVFFQLGESNLLELILGQGHGVTADVSLTATGHAPHSDIVALLVDHGFLVSALFLCFLLSSKYLFLSVYTIILFFTDNTMTYTVYLFSYFIVVMSLLNSRESLIESRM